MTGKGRNQAVLAGDWIRSWVSEHAPGGFDRLYCSPFVRTRETAALLDLPNAQWQLESLLRERDFGLWEGLGKQEIKQRFSTSFEQKARHKFLWRPECGESTPDLDRAEWEPITRPRFTNEELREQAEVYPQLWDGRFS